MAAAIRACVVNMVRPYDAPRPPDKELTEADDQQDLRAVHPDRLGSATSPMLVGGP
jgi:hypothetical protein